MLQWQMNKGVAEYLPHFFIGIVVISCVVADAVYVVPVYVIIVIVTLKPNRDCELALPSSACLTLCPYNSFDLYHSIFSTTSPSFFKNLSKKDGLDTSFAGASEMVFSLIGSATDVFTPTSSRTSRFF